jgi:carboxypeptidase Q
MSTKKQCLKIGCLGLALFITASFASPQPKSSPLDPIEKYQNIAQHLLEKGLRELPSYSILEKITSAGHRLSGSPGAAAAVEITRQIMLEMGLENVHLEPSTVPHWVRGPKEEALMISSVIGNHPLSISAIGGSVATSEDGLSARVIEVKNFTELESLNESAAGKIIFFNVKMDPGILNTFSAYGKAAAYRVRGAVEASKVGAAAALVRSPTTANDDFPHTGMMRYEPNVSKIPAACISTQGADLLSRSLKLDPDLRLFIRFYCQNLPPVRSYNVVGDLTGCEKPDEIILLGGHLDSWDLSPGAHDDGAGCAHALTALYLVKALDLRPKRTIRAVMFMNEEFGGSGGRDYAESENRTDERHILAVESDRGGFLPLGIGVNADEQILDWMQKWVPVFQSIQIHWIQKGGGGVDIAPLGKQGAVLAGLIPDSQRYFDVHHSGRDTLETVHPRELELGTIALSLLAIIVSEEGLGPNVNQDYLEPNGRLRLIMSSRNS